MPADLIKYIKQREENIYQLIGVRKVSTSLVKIHKLRVEIKKVTAIVTLLKACVDFKSKKNLKPFKKIFNKAGVLRELQLEQALIRKQGRKSIYITKFLNDKLHTARTDFLKLSGNKKLVNQKHTFKKINKSSAGVSKTKIVRYLNNLETELLELKSQNEIGSLHDLRKKLKIFQYISKSINRSTDKYEHLSSLLGKWHDYRIAINHFRNYKRKLKGERKILNSLIEYCKKQNKLLIDQL